MLGQRDGRQFPPPLCLSASFSPFPWSSVSASGHALLLNLLGNGLPPDFKEIVLQQDLRRDCSYPYIHSSEVYLLPKLGRPTILTVEFSSVRKLGQCPVNQTPELPLLLITHDLASGSGS